MARMCEQILLSQSDRVLSVKREWHTRRPSCYIVSDRHGKYLLLCQKLSVLVAFINNLAKDAGERVSVSAMHSIANEAGGRTCGYSKNRWRVVSCPLEAAPATFAAARAVGFEKAIVLGNPYVYIIR